jgi:hypothetical protein
LNQREWYASCVHSSVSRLLTKINALPEKIRTQFSGKLKYHLLLHLPDCILRFGAPTFTCTEKEESHNQRTRNVISKSNRNAYSLHTGETFSDYQNLHAILAGGSFYLSGSWMKANRNVLSLGKYLFRLKSEEKQNQARIHGDRIFATSGVSTSLGGFMEYEESDSKFIVIRIAQIQRKPLRITGNICCAVGHDDLKNVVYEVQSKSVDVSKSLHKLASVLNMQHLCDSTCRIVESEKFVENCKIPSLKMKHSHRPLYSLNSFCFSH